MRGQNIGKPSMRDVMRSQYSLLAEAKKSLIVFIAIVVAATIAFLSWYLTTGEESEKASCEKRGGAWITPHDIATSFWLQANGIITPGCYHI
jgi:hypothetical protein